MHALRVRASAGAQDFDARWRQASRPAFGDLAASTVAGAKISGDQVKLDEPLKTAGTHSVVLQLIDGVSATITVDVQTT